MIQTSAQIDRHAQANHLALLLKASWASQAAQILKREKKHRNIDRQFFSENNLKKICRRKNHFYTAAKKWIFFQVFL